MKSIQLLSVLLLLLLTFTSCKKESINEAELPVIGTEFIAGYTVAAENVLRSIPEEFINKARNELHVAYQHTSHGTQVAYGLYGLQDYKTGDDVLFGITNNNPTINKLDFRDYALASYAESGSDASDLSRDETAFIQATRNFLDEPQNADINVVMWSWCSISGHNVEDNYLSGMQTLINEYGVGGSKIGTGAEQRDVPVTFIFMTGHAEVNSNIGDGHPKNQADLIIDFCNEHNLYCLDYYSIDTHDMAGNYWEDSGDNGNSALYGGYFYTDWQGTHTLGVDFYENKNAPNGSVTFGAHTDQHITSNRKAFAMWYILARIAGWNGN